MELKSVRIGRLTTPNNVFLAPLAGFSDRAFREICIDCGAGLTFTEMVSAKGLVYKNAQTAELLKTSEKESIKAVQLFGSDAEIMRSACESEFLAPFDVVDINMGCPVPKVFNNGEGSALLDNLENAKNIISNCVKSGKIITVKMRTGVLKGSDTALELAKIAEGEGASMLTVHGRSREDYYVGDVNYDLIAEIKAKAKIPVIANGGIFTVEDADNMIEKTGADGIMLARGAIYKPELFSKITGKAKPDKYKMICHHVELALKDAPSESITITQMRKQLSAYVHGAKNSKQSRLKIFSATTFSEIKRILRDTQFD